MKDDIVFALYKDTAIGNKNEFREKIKKYIKDVNVGALFVKITNYQIDKYGKVLRNKIDDSYHSIEECYKMANKASTRRRARNHSTERERNKWKY